MHEHLSPLAGQTALLTGAGGGLGKEIALHLAQLGARIVLVGGPNDGHALDLVCSEYSALSQAHRVRVDLSERGSGSELIANLWREVGRIDIIVNSAAVRSPSAISDITLEDWERLMSVNLREPFFLCQAAASLMKANSVSGSIVNIASQLGLVSARGHALYAVSKAGVVAMTKALALEYARDGIVVNAVAPGPTNTGGANLMRNEVEAIDFLQRMPIARRVEPSEVAQAVGFLATRGGGAITGHTLVVDGGWTIW